MKRIQLQKCLLLIEEIDRLQSKGIIDLGEEFRHQELCDLSFDLYRLLDKTPPEVEVLKEVNNG